MAGAASMAAAIATAAAAAAASQVPGGSGPQVPSVPSVDLPPTWVCRSPVTQDVVDTRCPGGVKEWLYYR